VLRIDTRAEPSHDLAVNLDATGADQLLAVAAATDTGGGEHLLQAYATWHVGEAVAIASSIVVVEGVVTVDVGAETGSSRSRSG
jgi:hypothetical protein